MIVQELFSVLGLKVDKGQFDAGERALNGIKTVAGAVIAAFAIDKIAGWVHSVAEVADGASKASAKLGITAEAVQELGYAAKLSDIEQGELEASLARLAKGLDSVAQKGEGPTADALSRLGISFSDLKGEGLDANLEVIADAFAKMPDGTKKTALAMELFGKTGTKLIPLLNGGADGLKELREEAQRLGVVVSDETAVAFEEFNDDQTRLSETWRGIKTQVVSGLLPVFHEIVKSFQEWVDKNRELIQTGVQGLVTALAYGFKALAVAVEFVLKVFSALAEDSDVLMGVLIAFGAVLAALAIKAAAAWVAAAAPVIILGLAIAALGVGVMKLIKHWDKVKEAVRNALRFALDKLIEFKNALLAVPGQILDAFAALGESLVDAFVGAFDYIIEKAKEFASDVWKEVKDTPVIGRIIGGAESLLSGVSSPDSALSQAQAAIQTNQALVPAGAPESVSNTFGDVNVAVQAAPGMDEAKLADMAGKAAAEAQRNMLNSAASAVRGGRR